MFFIFQKTKKQKQEECKANKSSAQNKNKNKLINGKSLLLAQWVKRRPTKEKLNIIIGGNFGWMSKYPTVQDGDKWNLLSNQTDYIIMKLHRNNRQNETEKMNQTI